jgi:hypothetical protein
MKLVYARTLILIINLFFTAVTKGQDDTEFPPGFIMYAKLHNGMITNFHQGADLYVGGLQFVPEVTVVPGKLRAGIIAGTFYGMNKLEAQLGPTVAVKLKTFNAGPFGSAANVHLTGDHIWGTGKQKLAGGGIHLDLLNKLLLGLTAHRDYEFNTWWFQTALGLRISKVKKTREPFNE